MEEARETLWAKTQAVLQHRCQVCFLEGNVTVQLGPETRADDQAVLELRQAAESLGWTFQTLAYRVFGKVAALR